MHYSTLHYDRIILSPDVGCSIELLVGMAAAAHHHNTDIHWVFNHAKKNDCIFFGGHGSAAVRLCIATYSIEPTHSHECKTTKVYNTTAQ